MMFMRRRWPPPFIGADMGLKDIAGFTGGTNSLLNGAAPYEAVGTYDVGGSITRVLCVGDSTTGAEEAVITGCDDVIAGCDESVLVYTGCDVIILCRLVAVLLG